ncbi:hypothetical protein HDU96_010585 [Phlyctochytrium bullatum]|nr:hypothetical protein HDU96_010585 [Phlyctochytrium bullatum]
MAEDKDGSDANASGSSSESGSGGYDSSSSSNYEDELEDDRSSPGKASSYAKLEAPGGSKSQSRSYNSKYTDDSDDSSDDSDFAVQKREKSTSQRHHSQGTKRKGATKPKSNGARTVPFESVTMQMGDKSSIEKLVTWRMNADGTSEEILVKYKAGTDALRI